MKKKRVLAISFSKRWGNTELLLREALMGAEAEGAETEFICAYDYDIKPCDGCYACGGLAYRTGEGHYCIKNKNDDFQDFMDRMLDADGIIFGSPIYQMTPSGYYRLICDRIGPNYDMAYLEADKKLLGEKYRMDERLFNKRVGAFICVGGSAVFKYLSMALPLMNLITYPMQTEVVDQMLVGNSVQPAHVLMYDDVMDRANQLGRNVYKSIGVKKEELQWFAEPGTCPMCHSDMMILRGGDTVQCATCGMDGTAYLENGELKVDFPKEVWGTSRVTMEEKYHHGQEVAPVMDGFMRWKHNIPEKIKKYKEHPIPVAKPRRKSKA